MNFKIKLSRFFIVICVNIVEFIFDKFALIFGYKRERFVKFDYRQENLLFYLKHYIKCLPYDDINWILKNFVYFQIFQSIHDNEIVYVNIVFNDHITVELNYNFIVWKKNNRKHRDNNKCAEIWLNGGKRWYENGHFVKNEI